jgi:hypothetical protein
MGSHGGVADTAASEAVMMVGVTERLPTKTHTDIKIPE